MEKQGGVYQGVLFGRIEHQDTFTGNLESGFAGAWKNGGAETNAHFNVSLEGIQLPGY